MLLVGLPIHEFSHALAAYRLGDGTAKLYGRLTLNPVAHFDPVGGTLLALTFIGSRGDRSAVRVRLGQAHSGQPVEPRGRASRRGDRRRCRTALELRPGRGRGDPASIPPREPGARCASSVCSATVLFLFVQINLLLMIFNLIPIPPLDGSKVLFAFLDRRTEYQIRPFLEQYGFLILLALLFFPPGQLDRRPDHLPDPRCAQLAPGGDAKVRQFRAHLRASVTPAERAGLEAWTTAAQRRALRRDARCRPAPRARRGRLAPRRRRRATRTSLIAGLLHDAGKGATGVWPRVAYSLGQRYGAWVWRVAGVLPGFGGALRRLRAHAEVSARMAAEAGCSPRAVDLIRYQDAPRDPEFGELLRLADEAN